MSRSKICVSLFARTSDEMHRRLVGVPTSVGFAEVRLDALSADELRIFIERFDRTIFVPTVIGTFRPVSQGGMSNAAPNERIEFWRRHGHLFDLVDIESDIFADVGRKAQSIISEHRFVKSAEPLLQFYNRLADNGADIVKIAAISDDVGDAIDVWRLLAASEKRGVRVIPIAMGESGRWTRLLGPAYGGVLTYANDLDGDTTGPGQFDRSTMADLFRVDAITKSTSIFGIIGKPVSRSLSPWMHNAAFAATEFDGVFVPIETNDIDAVFSGLIGELQLPIRGLSVTMPHKVAVLDHLDELDETAAAVGAVNTVRRETDGKLIGHNTDVAGFIRPLKQRLGDLSDMRVAIIGGGGAARACVHGLTQANAEPVLFVRDTEKVQQEFDRVEVRDISTISREISEFDILVNASPIGMVGNDDTLPLSGSDLGNLKCVFDLVTRPDDSPLITLAANVRVPTIAGFEMLIEQGIEQFRIWTGREAPRDIIERAARQRLAQLK